MADNFRKVCYGFSFLNKMGNFEEGMETDLFLINSVCILWDLPIAVRECRNKMKNSFGSCNFRKTNDWVLLSNNRECFRDGMGSHLSLISSVFITQNWVETVVRKEMQCECCGLVRESVGICGSFVLCLNQRQII